VEPKSANETVSWAGTIAGVIAKDRPFGHKICVIIPAYNEEAVVSSVVSSVQGRGYLTVVVSDGSTDQTAELARKAGAVVLQHPINLGQGAALQTGIEFALLQGSEVIVTFDADGQHRADEISVLVAALIEHRADFALGSRFLGAAPRIPRLRRALLRLAIWFTRATTGLKLTDVHNGLRAMTRRGAMAIALRQNRMAHASEMLVQIAKAGLSYVEVPVTIEYTGYSLRKGQKVSELVVILIDLLARGLHR
jgi:glycosyltransferase involved in cell wall biosynthesis